MDRDQLHTALEGAAKNPSKRAAAVALKAVIAHLQMTGTPKRLLRPLKLILASFDDRDHGRLPEIFKPTPKTGSPGDPNAKVDRRAFACALVTFAGRHNGQQLKDIAADVAPLVGMWGDDCRGIAPEDQLLEWRHGLRKKSKRARRHYDLCLWQMEHDKIPPDEAVAKALKTLAETGE